jgi:hypothetical protein
LARFTNTIMLNARLSIDSRDKKYINQ